jgi:glycosyltransferase involved in cell wall biosynthesis
MNRTKPHENQVEISIIIPAFNEEESITHSLEVIDFVVSKITNNFEIIVVNDGSTDSTKQLIILAKTTEARLRLIDSSVNRGHMAALEAGLRASSGNFIVSIDADMQDDPNVIADMYSIIKQKDEAGNQIYDVVQAVRTTRSSDTVFKRISAKIYYKLIRKLTGIPIAHHAADFRMITKKTNEILCALPENRKIYRLLIPSIGFNVFNLETVRHKRYAGASKYHLSKMINLALNSFLDFSIKPLRLMIKVGLFSTLIMFSFGIATLLLWVNGSTIPGWTSLVFLLLASNSLIVLSLGVLGVYIGNLHEQVKARPSGIWKEIQLHHSDDDLRAD